MSDVILRQFHPPPIQTTYSPNVYLNVILPSPSLSSKGSFASILYVFVSSIQATCLGVVRRAGALQLGSFRADALWTCRRVRSAGIRALQRAGVDPGDAAASQINASLDAAPAVDLLLDAAR